MFAKMKRPPSLVPLTIVILFSLCMTYTLLYVAFFHLTTTIEEWPDAEHNEKHKAILGYLHGPLFAENTLTFLTPNERSHMTDVKELFDGLFILNLCTLGILLGIIGVFVVQRFWLALDYLLGRSLFLSGVLILSATFLLALLASLSFTGFWTGMHALLFPQGNWEFPYDSTLITLYPESFFTKMATGFFLRTILVGLCVLILGFFINKMRQEAVHFEKRFTHKKTGGKK